MFSEKTAIDAEIVDEIYATSEAGLMGKRMFDVGVEPRVEGARGNDLIVGGKQRRGRQWLAGGFGRDVIRGGPGRDLLLGEDGFDRLFGGPGLDECQVSAGG